MSTDGANMLTETGADAATVIRLENITKRFGAITAVKDISLNLKENEFFALLGPSGCGKTTLLRKITPQVVRWKLTIIVRLGRMSGPTKSSQGFWSCPRT